MLLVCPIPRESLLFYGFRAADSFEETAPRRALLWAVISARWTSGARRRRRRQVEAIEVGSAQSPSTFLPFFSILLALMLLCLAPNGRFAKRIAQHETAARCSKFKASKKKPASSFDRPFPNRPAHPVRLATKRQMFGIARERSLCQLLIQQQASSSGRSSRLGKGAGCSRKSGSSRCLWH